MFYMSQSNNLPAHQAQCEAGEKQVVKGGWGTLGLQNPYVCTHLALGKFLTCFHFTPAGQVHRQG